MASRPTQPKAACKKDQKRREEREGQKRSVGSIRFKHRQLKSPGLRLPNEKYLMNILFISPLITRGKAAFHQRRACRYLFNTDHHKRQVIKGRGLADEVLDPGLDLHK